MPKTLILGSTGFFGRALSSEMERRGLACHGLGSKTLDLTSSEASSKLASLYDADTTLILASRVRQGSAWERFSGDVKIAAQAAQALSARPAKRCLFTSSSAVYGSAKTDLAVTEETPVAPGTLYGIAKLAGECLLRQACAQSHTPLVIVRPGMVYGPGDTGSAYGPTRLIRSVIASGQAELFGDGGELRDNLYIDDLVGMIADLSQQGAEGVYNLGSGAPASFLKIVEEIQRLSGRPVKIVALPRSQPKIDQRLIIRKVQQAVPERATTPLAAGLEKTYLSFVDHEEKKNAAKN